MNRKWRTRRGKCALIGAAALLAALALLYVFYGVRSKKTDGETFQGSPGEKRTADRLHEVRDRPKKPAIRDRISPEEQAVAIIIDDIGCDLAPVRELLKLDAPIAFAILPYCPHSLEASEIIHRAGREVLLHLPMEPHAFPEVRPGPGALLLSMKEDELRQRVDEALRRVRHVRGVNNHMGSKFMEEEGPLSVVLGHLKSKGLYFVDSRTTPRSRGEDLSQAMGLRFLSRSEFIDPAQEGTTVPDKLNRLSEKQDPRKRAAHVVIGHPYPGTIEALKEALPEFKAKGIHVVTLSEIMNLNARRNAFSSKGGLLN